MEHESVFEREWLEDTDDSEAPVSVTDELWRRLDPVVAAKVTGYEMR